MQVIFNTNMLLLLLSLLLLILLLLLLFFLLLLLLLLLLLSLLLLLLLPLLLLPLLLLLILFFKYQWNVAVCRAKIFVSYLLTPHSFIHSFIHSYTHSLGFKCCRFHCNCNNKYSTILEIQETTTTRISLNSFI